MAARKYITEQECAKIWMLHNKGLGTKEISTVTDVSTASVDRVVAIFEKTKEGQFAEITKRFGNSHPRIRAYAKEFFNVKEQEAPKEPKKQEAAPQLHDNTARCMVKVLEELQTISTLLRALCKEVGVQDA